MIRDGNELKSFYRILGVLKKHVPNNELVDIKREIREYNKKEANAA